MNWSTVSEHRHRGARATLRLGAALLLAGACVAACGSSTHPAARTSNSTAAAATSSTAAGTQNVAVDLNGHRITGVKARDIAAEQQPDKPLSRATRKVLAHQLVVARAVAMRYPTVADATAAGYRLVGGGFGPGSGAHYIGGYGSFGRAFDASRPMALIYDGIAPTSQMVGLMYYSMGLNPPAGFAGPNDHWHRHSGVCMGPGSVVLFPPDSSVTAKQCADAHGFYMWITGWMVHAWVVPGWESPSGVFSHENPDLRCADGTYNTDRIGRCQGSS